MDQIVPLSNAPNQSMTVNLSINDSSLLLQLTCNYNEMLQYWVMGISDTNGNNILSDIPLLTGVYPASNILSQYQYLNIGSACVLDVSNDDVRDYPKSDDLGIGFVLLWSDNA
jgi:hypothetical protein